MRRRHSICLTDLPPYSHLPAPHRQTSYNHNDPNDRITLSRTCCSIPIMSSLVLPQLDGPAATRKANKKKKKKKKKKLDEVVADDKGLNAQSICESLPEYGSVPGEEHTPASAGLGQLGLPLVIDGASWGQGFRRGLGQNGYSINHAPHSQETLSTVQSSAATLLLPSVIAPAGGIDRAASTHPQSPARGDPNKPPPDQIDLPYCPAHGTATCRFNPACCVHKARLDCACPRRPSCCCVHYAGDCCTCVYIPKVAYANRAYKTAYHGLPSCSLQWMGKSEGMTVGTTRVPGQVFVREDGPDAQEVSKKRGLQVNGEATKKEAAMMTHDSEWLATSTYLLCLFDSEDFHDSRFVLKSTKDHFPPIIIRTHKLLIARSPFVASLLRAPESHQQGFLEIVSIAGENFLLLKAFEVALQNLYSLPLLSQERLRSMTLSSLGYTEDNIKMSPYPINTAMADFAMCYASSGAFLQHREMVETGVKLIVQNITWDNIELIFYFGFCISNFLITSPSPSPLVPSPSPLTSPTTTATNTTKPSDKPEGTTDELQTKWAPHLLTAALNFVISHMPADFTLDPKAHCKGMPDRIPEYLHPAPTASLMNPKLAAVQFGSFSTAAEQEQKHGLETATISAVLVCLPYTQLKNAFVKMNARRVLSSELAQAIVLERETRRLQALRVFARLRSQTEKPGLESGVAAVTTDREIPGEILELGFAEFYTSRNVFSHARDEEATVALEISLEREWIGLAVGEVMVKHRVLNDKKE